MSDVGVDTLTKSCGRRLLGQLLVHRHPCQLLMQKLLCCFVVRRLLHRLSVWRLPCRLLVRTLLCHFITWCRGSCIVSGLTLLQKGQKTGHDQAFLKGYQRLKPSKKLFMPSTLGINVGKQGIPIESEDVGRAHYCSTLEGRRLRAKTFNQQRLRYQDATCLFTKTIIKVLSHSKSPPSLGLSSPFMQYAYSFLLVQKYPYNDYDISRNILLSYASSRVHLSLLLLQCLLLIGPC